MILLQKMHQKLLPQLKNRERQNPTRQKFCREIRANRANRFHEYIKIVHIINHRLSKICMNPPESASKSSKGPLENFSKILLTHVRWLTNFEVEHIDGKSTAFQKSLRILDLRHFRVHSGRIKKDEIRFITLNINCEFYKIYNIIYSSIYICGNNHYQILYFCLEGNGIGRKEMHRDRSTLI